MNPQQIQQLRINEQAALLSHLRSILASYQTKFNKYRSSIKYKNFATLRNKSTDPTGGSGNIGSHRIMSLLFRTRGLEDFITKLPRNLLAKNLTGQVSLYKMFTNGDKEVSYLIPFYKNITYSYKDGEERTAADQKAYILSHLNGGDKALLTNFTFNFIGTNEAEANTFLDGSFEMVFNNPETLVNENLLDQKQIVGDASGFSSRGLRWSFSDFVATSKLAVNLQEPTQRIKAEISLVLTIPDTILDDPNTPENEAKGSAAFKADLANSLRNENFFSDRKFTNDEEYIEEFKKVVSTMKITLYLAPYSHEIEIFGTSAIKVKVNYTGYIDQILNSPCSNIFNVYDSYAEIRDIDNKIKNLKKTQLDELDQLKKDVSGKAEGSEKIKDLEKKQAEQLKKIESDLSRTRSKMYQAVLAKLLNLQMDKEYPKSQGLSGADPYSKVVDSDEAKGIYRVKMLKKTLGIVTTKSILGNNTNVQAYDFFTGVKYIRGLDRIESGTTLFDRNDYEKTILNFSFVMNINTLEPHPFNEEVANATTVVKTSESDEHTFNFMFFGDIVDVAAESIYSAACNDVKDFAKPRIILGDIKLLIPSGLKDSKDRAIYDEVVLNIADIPISFNLFINFYTSLIAKERPTNISFTTFITKAINELLTTALSPSISGNSAGFTKNNIRIGVNTFTYPFVDNKDSLLNIPKNDRFSGIIYDTTLKALFDNKRAYESVKDGDGNYILFYDASRRDQELLQAKGNPDLDRELGIVHILANTGIGTIKKVNFTRVDAPMLREALVKVGVDSGQKTGELKQVYDVEIETIPGNFSYRPGDLLYIEPYFAAMSTPTNSINKIIASNKLGFGGYYMVINNNSVYNGLHITSKIKCSLHAWLEGETVDGN